MTRHWKFGDLEFVVRWEAMGERLPLPLFTTGRGPDRESYERQKTDFHDQFRRDPDRELEDMMEVLRQPEIKILVDGAEEDPNGKVIRQLQLLAAMTGDRGFLVTQLPGETDLHASGFTVTQHESHALATAIIHEFPRMRPGRLGDVTLAEHDESEEFDFTFGRSVIRDHPAASVSSRAKNLLNAPVAMTGTIHIVQGKSRYGPRGITGHALRWRDVVDDGRYVITDGDPQVAVSANRLRFADLVNARIAEVSESVYDDRQ